MNFQVMPDLSPEEYEELKADIAARGVMVAIEFDEDGNVLDGHHRLKICEELGITDYPRTVREGLTDEEKRFHARKLNMARRHLNQDQRRTLIREQLKETPEYSNRRIADQLNVDHKTIAAQRYELEKSGEIPHPVIFTSKHGGEWPERPTVVPGTSPPAREMSEMDKANERTGYIYRRSAEINEAVFRLAKLTLTDDDCIALRASLMSTNEIEKRLRIIELADENLRELRAFLLRMKKPHVLR